MLSGRVEHRMEPGHTLCWGSDPFEPVLGTYWETHEVDNLQGAKFESGLDNSPMYDDVPYNEKTHKMQLADVGLTGLYIMDCEALADLARALGRSEAAELTAFTLMLATVCLSCYNHRHSAYERGVM